MRHFNQKCNPITLDAASQCEYLLSLTLSLSVVSKLHILFLFGEALKETSPVFFWNGRNNVWLPFPLVAEANLRTPPADVFPVGIRCRVLWRTLTRLACGGSLYRLAMLLYSLLHPSEKLYKKSPNRPSVFLSNVLSKPFPLSTLSLLNLGE